MTRANLPEKWIEGLNAVAPATEAARRVVGDRLEAVDAIMRKVVKTKAERDEAVHQLRVATRRAEAALLAFKPWLKRERRRQVRKALRRLRGAAGSVRMCDVHRELLGRTLREGDPARTAAVEAALLLLDRDRQAARRELFAATRRVASRDVLEPDEARLVRRSRTSPSANAASLAAAMSLEQAGQAALRGLANDLIVAAGADLTSRENLHQLRLRGKRLRYALEIFGSTTGEVDSLAALGQSMIDLQERLGLVNDRHEVAERLARYAAGIEAVIDEAAVAAGTDHAERHSALAPEIERLADHFEFQCAQLAGEFLDWWRSDANAATQRQLQQLASEASPNPVAEAAATPEVVVVNRNGEIPRRESSVAAAITEAQETGSI